MRPSVGGVLAQQPAHLPQPGVGRGGQGQRALGRGFEPAGQDRAQPGALGGAVAGHPRAAQDQLPQQRLDGRHRGHVEAEGVLVGVQADQVQLHRAVGAAGGVTLGLAVSADGAASPAVADAASPQAAPAPLTVFPLLSRLAVRRLREAAP